MPVRGRRGHGRAAGGHRGLSDPPNPCPATITTRAVGAELRQLHPSIAYGRVKDGSPPTGRGLWLIRARAGGSASARVGRSSAGPLLAGGRGPRARSDAALTDAPPPWMWPKAPDAELTARYRLSCRSKGADSILRNASLVRSSIEKCRTPSLHACCSFTTLDSGGAGPDVDNGPR